MEGSCSITDVLAGGIPDVPVTGGWETYALNGTTMSGIFQYDSHDGSLYSLGTYSHTADGVSYYMNGDSDWCNTARTSKVTWE